MWKALAISSDDFLEQAIIPKLVAFDARSPMSRAPSSEETFEILPPRTGHALRTPDDLSSEDLVEVIRDESMEGLRLSFDATDPRPPHGLDGSGAELQ